MSKMVATEIILLLFLSSNYIISSKEVYNISQLEEFSIIKPEWNPALKYIYFLNIEQYSLNDEIIIQIITEDSSLLLNITLHEIDETYILVNKTEEIDIKKEANISKSVKYRCKPRKFYKEILVKKKKSNQKLFVLLLNPALLRKNKTDLELAVTNKIPIVNIHKSGIADGNCFNEIYKMDPKIEQFIKFNITNISLDNHNLVLYINEQGVSSFYLGDLNGNKRRMTSLFIYEKKSTKENNFVIYLSLLGQANEAKLQIMLDDHDLIYTYSSSRRFLNHYIEKLNCTKDFFIFESYQDIFSGIRSESFSLDVIPLYGDYEIFYNDISANYINNITSLFSKNNNGTQKIEGITPLNSDMSAFILSCKKPTLIGVKYIGQNININISEGQEITCTFDKNRFWHNFIFLKDLNKEYVFYFGFYKLSNESAKYISNYHSMKNFDPSKYYGTFFSLNTAVNVTEEIRKIYYGKERDKIEFDIESQNNGVNLKIYLISNQYYKNIIEGATKLIPGEKAIAFKIRNDIIFDYFIFKAQNNKAESILSMNYELKIVENKFIEKDKVMLGINPFLNYGNHEVNMKFSNPYNKFNTRVKEGEFVYLLAEFLLVDELYPIYVDIRYYYDDKIISIDEAKPKILMDNKEYKIYGNKNSDNVDNILININKCNSFNNYIIKTFYENDNNLISEENIINQRTLLLHKNLFNDTKIIIHANNLNNNTKIELNQQKSYYENGDIYMNYFSLKNKLDNLVQITENYSILHEDIDSSEILFKWNPYICQEQQEIFPVNYSIYILPQDSQINSICQMSLIPPNISLINKSKYKIHLEKGKYKINIIASVVNEDFPLITSYDFLQFEVSNRVNIKLILILTVPSFALILVLIVLITYCKYKNKKDEIDNLKDERRTKLLSALGFNDSDEKEGIIFNNNDEDEINNDLKNIEDNNVNEFSVSSE